MAGDPAREGRRQVAAGVIGGPGAGIDPLDRFAGSAPGQGLAAAEQAAYRGDRPHAVEFALEVPGHDAGVEGGVVHREEHLHVLVEGVAVAGRNRLGEEPPMPGWQLGIGAIGPVLDDQLLAGVQRAGDAQNLVHVGLQLRRTLQEARSERGLGSAVELAGRAQGEGRHALPVRGDKALNGAGIAGQGLPTRGIGGVGDTGVGGRRQAKRHRPIHRCVAGVIGIGADGQVAILVGPIVAPGGNDGGRGRVAHTLRRGQVGGQVQRVIAAGAHHGFQARRAGRVQIDQAPIGRVAHGLGLVGVVGLGAGPARDRAGHRGDGTRVVRCPGVVHAGVGDGQRARRDRWSLFGQPHFLQCGSVPGDDGRRCRLGLCSQRQAGQEQGRASGLQSVECHGDPSCHWPEGFVAPISRLQLDSFIPLRACLVHPSLA